MHKYELQNIFSTNTVMGVLYFFICFSLYPSWSCFMWLLSFSRVHSMRVQGVEISFQNIMYLQNTNYTFLIPNWNDVLCDNDITFISFLRKMYRILPAHLYCFNLCSNFMAIHFPCFSCCGCGRLWSTQNIKEPRTYWYIK